MARTENIAALDIGTTKVCILTGKLNPDGRLTATAFAMLPSSGIQKGVVVDMDAVTGAVLNAAEQVERQLGQELGPVYLGVTGEHISSLNSQGRVTVSEREITSQDVQMVLAKAREIVLPPNRQILHVIPRGFVIDGQNGVKHPEGMYGSRLEVHTHIVHGATTFLQNVEKCVQKAGLTIAERVLEPIASAQAALLEAEKQLGVCLIDIGGGTTDVAAFAEGSIFFSCVIPVGGSHVTSDLAYGLTVAGEEAERLKTESGSALAEAVPADETVPVQQMGRDEPRLLRRRALAQIIEPRMQELFELVRDELEKAGCLEQIPAGFVICGGGSSLAGCAEIAQQVFQLPVRTCRLERMEGMEDKLHDPRYATAVGLLQYGAQKTFMASETRSRTAQGRSWLDRAVQKLWELFGAGSEH